MPEKVSLAHHWFEFIRGGEAVLAEFCRLFPQAPLYTLAYEPKVVSGTIADRSIHGSMFQRPRWLRRRFRNFLPLFPIALKNLRVDPETTLLLSSDASLIKGLSFAPGTIHVCYCHSPPRYLWGMQDTYVESNDMGWLAKIVFRSCTPYLRKFDQKASKSVTTFIANSEFVRLRIKLSYGRDARVIHPPVNIDAFDYQRPRDEFYLVVSALVPYKRVDLAVKAATNLGRNLVIIGAGPEERYLKSIAGETVKFMSHQKFGVVKDHFERCRAFIFPGVEDFGITPCEAQAAGAPVVAFGEGGALETVRDGVTGIFFKEQSVEGLQAALVEFEEKPPFDPAVCRANVAHLGPGRFRREIHEFLMQEFPKHWENYVWPEEVATEQSFDRTSSN